MDAMRPGAHVDFESKDGVMTAEDELRARTPSGVTIEPFDMRRSMAAAPAGPMRAAVRDEAREALLAKITNGTSTRDIVVEFNTLKRRAHAVYHPMWSSSSRTGPSSTRRRTKSSNNREKPSSAASPARS